MLKKILTWYASRAAVPFWLLALTDCLIVFLSAPLAYTINHSLSTAVSSLAGLMATAGIFTICFTIGFRIFHTYARVLKATTVGDLARIGMALFIGCVIILALQQTTAINSLIFHPFRLRDLMMLAFISLVLMGGVRVAAKALYNLYIRYTTSGGTNAYGFANKDLINMEMSDLLPREPIEINLKEVEAAMSGSIIMVTGAAGSIGSELAYLLAATSPLELILVDQAESPLHDVRINMERLHPGLKCHTIVTSICHSSRMEHIFNRFKPEYVFHAAAYKHVPMMEDNPIEAVLNNIDGTRKIADLAVKFGVKKFVMISTDKAVNPTNVMGCSKRICEIYCQSLSATQSATQFITTRFGNVLGSNGSVIPTFREQIRRGGPVLVTHPRVIRYFMLISEACSLVLEAATIGKGGQVLAFDMGSPVKIVDLARRMILLSGHCDIKIEFTGLRPGEKLFEEVLTAQEVTLPTSNPKIRIAKVQAPDFNEVQSAIDSLIATARTYDPIATVKLMKQLVPEFKSATNSPYAMLELSSTPLPATVSIPRSSA